MPTLTGLCEGCQKPLTKYVKPGKKLRCLSCGVRHATEHMRTMQNGTNPQLLKSRVAGAEAARQIREKSGPAYERYQTGMQRRWRREALEKMYERGTLPDNQPGSGITDIGE